VCPSVFPSPLPYRFSTLLCCRYTYVSCFHVLVLPVRRSRARGVAMVTPFLGVALAVSSCLRNRRPVTFERTP
jgi:hypothetical protein